MDDRIWIEPHPSNLGYPPSVVVLIHRIRQQKFRFTLGCVDLELILSISPANDAIRVRLGDEYSPLVDAETPL